MFPPLGDPVTSHWFILLRFIGANGGQSGVPPPLAVRVCSSLFVLCFTTGWLLVTKISQEPSRTIIPVAE